ncbi:hypothetical protein [Dactylosporangium sp. CA-139066]|uniref:hypothetical protein n=1 Tax=Dactylosporangium sp. CA-139066 TaxID=3239930 RepID=UPI003D91943B
MTVVRFGASAEPRPLRWFVLICAPFVLIPYVFGIQLAVGDLERGPSAQSWWLMGTGAGFALLGTALVAVEAHHRRGRYAGPDGVVMLGRTMPWSDISRISLHAGAGGRELVAVWRSGATAPVWLGAANHANVPRDEALALIEQWSGRRIDD